MRRGLYRCLFFGAVVAVAMSLRAEDIRINLDQPGDARVKPRIDANGFAIRVEIDSHLQKSGPVAIHIDTQQTGRWRDATLEVGRYLTKQFDSEKPQELRLETTLKFDLAAGERRFTQERDAVNKKAHERTGGGRDKGALERAKKQLLLERIAAIRDENINAGADKRGKATRNAPALPRQALDFEKPEALENILRLQCRWQSVADVFKATAFAPPEEKEHPDLAFAAADAMAEEIQKALAGIKFTAKHLIDGQQRVLDDGGRYHFTADFVPTLADAPADMLWKAAPAVRIADGFVKRAQLEGSLDRERGPGVEWWRVECDTFPKLDAKMIRGDGDCFWTWVEGPRPHERFVRVLLHSPGTRYRLNLQLSGAAKGEELLVYDGPVNAPAKGPF